MKIEVPRKTAYYKRKQAEHIFQSLKITAFALKSEEFWDFVVLIPNNVKLIKVISSNEKKTKPPLDRQYGNLEREIWRFSPFKKMPDIEILEKNR